MAKVCKDPVTGVAGRGDPGVLAVLPAPTSGHHALQETETEAGNRILFLPVFGTSILTVPEGCFENKKKSKMCIVFE